MPTYEYECKQFNPPGRVPRAAVSYSGLSVRAQVSFSRATVFMQRIMQTVPPAQDAGPGMLQEGEMEQLF